MSDAPTPQTQARGMASSSLLMGLTTVGGALSGLVRTKLLALTIGPAGIGVYGQLSALQQVVTIVATFGLTSALVRELAARRAGGWDKEAAHQVGQVAAAQAALASVLVAILIAFAVPLAGYFLADRSHADALRIAAIGIPGALLAALIENISIAKGASGRYIWTMLIDAALTTALAAALILSSGLRGAQVYLAAGPWLSVVVASVALWRDVPAGSSRASARAFLRPDRVVLVGYFVFGATIAAGFFLRQATGIVVRSMILRVGGSAAAGLYQLGFAFSSYYVTFFCQPLLNIAYPGFAAAALMEDSLSSLRRWLNLVAIAIPPLLVIYILALPILVRLLSSRAFLGATPISSWQAAGDFFYIVLFLLRAHFFAHRREARALAFEVLFDVCVLGLSWVGLRASGVVGVGQAHCGAAAISLAIAAGPMFGSIARAIALPAVVLVAVAWSTSGPDALRLSVGAIALAILGARVLLGDGGARILELVRARRAR